MRTVFASEITKTIKQLCLEANFDIGESMINALKDHSVTEASPLGKNILTQIIENDQLAKYEKIAICQDTGMVVVFIKLGQEVIISDGDFNEAIQEGVRQAYHEGYLRKSVVKDPLFDRSNTQDNTPAIIHVSIVPGDQIEIDIMPKGFGSENMSTLKMFAPSAGLAGVKAFILETVQKAGPNACPPMIIGIGIGGTFEQAAYLAKHAILRGVNQPNLDPNYAKLEAELLTEINKMGIGPAGLGGSTSALSINIDYYPTHIASIPVAINISCHASRHASAVI